jgi:hypothetical protein
LQLLENDCYGQTQTDTPANERFRRVHASSTESTTTIASGGRAGSRHHWLLSRRRGHRRQPDSGAVDGRRTLRIDVDGLRAERRRHPDARLSPVPRARRRRRDGLRRLARGGEGIETNTLSVWCTNSPGHQLTNSLILVSIYGQSALEGIDLLRAGEHPD